MQRTVTNEQDNSLLWVNFLSGHGGTQTGTSGVTNGTPQDLGDTVGVVRESSLVDTESGSTGLSDDNVTILQELANLVPHPFLGQRSLGVTGLVLWGSWWNWDRLVTLDGVRDSRQKLLQDKFHLDTWESGVSNLDVVRVELDDVFGLVRVRERTSVEVRQQSTDGQDQVSGLDSLLNVWSGQGTDVNTTESWVLLIDRTLTHWGNESWELGHVNQLLGLSLDIVSRGTGVGQDDWVLGVLD